MNHTMITINARWLPLLLPPLGEGGDGGLSATSVSQRARAAAPIPTFPQRGKGLKCSLQRSP